MIGYWVMGLLTFLLALGGLGLAIYGLVTLLRKLADREKRHFDNIDDPVDGSIDVLSPSGKEPSSFVNVAPPNAGQAPANILKRRFITREGAAGNFIMDSLFARGIVIAAIVLGLLIPLSFVDEVVDDRSSMHSSAVQNIADLWGRPQKINGPVLVIPYKRMYETRETIKDEDGKQKVVLNRSIAQEHRIILPKLVHFTAKLAPQVLHRSIYESIVYSSDIQIKGDFRLPKPEIFGEDIVAIEWEKSWFAIGITDLRAITGVTPLVWSGTECAAYSPGTNTGSLLGPGFHAEVPLDAQHAGQEYGFSLSLELKGSRGIHFTPVGETTLINVSGDWPHPSFSGSLLPTSRLVEDTSFTGEWNIPHLSRTYPQSGVLGRGDFGDRSNAITSFTAGVDLFETVSLYTQVNRSVKYGILFIGLTFIALFSFELLSKTRLHLMQYALVGIAMTLFYLTLLSLAEHTSFLVAFAAASLISILMNGLYIMAAMRSRNRGLVVIALLTALYLLLYALLQMEEYALLMGTFMVLIVVGVLMFLTRNLPVYQPTDGGKGSSFFRRRKKNQQDNAPHGDMPHAGMEKAANIMKATDGMSATGTADMENTVTPDASDTVKKP